MRSVRGLVEAALTDSNDRDPWPDRARLFRPTSGLGPRCVSHAPIDADRQGLRHLRLGIWALLGLIVTGPLAASIALAASGWTGGPLGVMLQWLGLAIVLLAGYMAIRLERDPAVHDRYATERVARGEAMLANAEVKMAREREKARVREFHEIARDPVMLELMKQKAMRMGSG